MLPVVAAPCRFRSKPGRDKGLTTVKIPLKRPRGTLESEIARPTEYVGHTWPQPEPFDVELLCGQKCCFPRDYYIAYLPGPIHYLCRDAQRPAYALAKATITYPRPKQGSETYVAPQVPLVGHMRRPSPTSSRYPRESDASEPIASCLDE